MRRLRAGVVSPVSRNLIHPRTLLITIPPRPAFYGTPHALAISIVEYWPHIGQFRVISFAASTFSMVASRGIE